MIISQIPQNLRTIIQLRIILPSIPLPIRHPAIQLQSSTRHHPQYIQPQTGAKSGFELWRFVRDKHITRNQIPTIPKADHEASSERSFGITAHVVGEPDD
jgi:hypothetical protein